MGTHLGWGHRMVALLSGAALVTGLVAVSVPASAQRAAGSLTASPSTAIAGEKVTFTGALGVSGARKVVLQRKQGADWVKVIGGASTKRGKFTLVSTVRPTTTKYRVRAPAAKVGGTARPAVITRSRTVTTQAQSATLALPAAAAVGAAVTATATFAPARPGRPVQLQRQVGAGWSAARTGVQGPDGTASFPVDTSVPGTQVYRVVTTAANGAGETASASRTLVMTAVHARATPAGHDAPRPGDRAHGDRDHRDVGDPRLDEPVGLGPHRRDGPEGRGSDTAGLTHFRHAGGRQGQARRDARGHRAHPRHAVLLRAVRPRRRAELRDLRDGDLEHGFPGHHAPCTGHGRVRDRRPRRRRCRWAGRTLRTPTSAG